MREVTNHCPACESSAREIERLTRALEIHERIETAERKRLREESERLHEALDLLKRHVGTTGLGIIQRAQNRA